MNHNTLTAASIREEPQRGTYWLSSHTDHVSLAPSLSRSLSIILSLDFSLAVFFFLSISPLLSFSFSLSLSLFPQLLSLDFSLSLSLSLSLPLYRCQGTELHCYFFSFRHKEKIQSEVLRAALTGMEEVALRGKEKETALGL